MSQYKKNQIASPLVFLMISSVDHISPLLGGTPVVTLSKNGGSFGAAVGAVAEIGNGWYKLVPNIADFNTIGPLLLHATAVGGDPQDVVNEVVSGTVDLAATQHCDIIGNIKGSVTSVVNAVKCSSVAKCI